VAILNPEHLFEQAEKLIAPSPAGAPRQVDLRRAISGAYYGIFHATLIAAADHFVGMTKRSSTEYALVYRSINHGSLRNLCSQVMKPNLPANLLPYGPRNAFGPDIRAFAAAVVELQEKRHSADYDPLIRVKSSDALLAVSVARSAAARFKRASARRRNAFLTFLLFPRR
jgi:uncharacterized protein (UPF0332 family)